MQGTFCIKCGIDLQTAKNAEPISGENIHTFRFVAPYFSLAELATLSTEIAEAHGWHARPRQFPEFIALVHSELSEALDGYRKGLKDDHLPQYRMQDVELADVLIRIFDWCGQYKIPIEHILTAKLQHNMTREYRHGNQIA